MACASGLAIRGTMVSSILQSPNAFGTSTSRSSLGSLSEILWLGLSASAMPAAPSMHRPMAKCLKLMNLIPVSKLPTRPVWEEKAQHPVQQEQKQQADDEQHDACKTMQEALSRLVTQVVGHQHQHHDTNDVGKERNREDRSHDDEVAR